MISAEKLVEIRAKVKREMSRRNCTDHGENASLAEYSDGYDYDTPPVTGGDITDEHIQKIVDPLLNVADFCRIITCNKAIVVQM